MGSNELRCRSTVDYVTRSSAADGGEFLHVPQSVLLHVSQHMASRTHRNATYCNKRHHELHAIDCYTFHGIKSARLHHHFLLLVPTPFTTPQRAPAHVSQTTARTTNSPCTAKRPQPQPQPQCSAHLLQTEVKVVEQLLHRHAISGFELATIEHLIISCGAKSRCPENVPERLRGDAAIGAGPLLDVSTHTRT